MIPEHEVCFPGLVLRAPRPVSGIELSSVLREQLETKAAEIGMEFEDFLTHIYVPGDEVESW